MGSSAKYDQLLKIPMYDIFITLNLSNPPFLISSPRYYPGKLPGGLRMLQFSLQVQFKVQNNTNN